MLRDDRKIEVFPSTEACCSKVELIDIENDEYRFADEGGQRYIGVVTRPSRWFSAGEFRLDPEGCRSLRNTLELIDSAQGIEDNNDFTDLESLRRYVIKRSQEHPK